MHSSIALIIASALTTLALPQTQNATTTGGYVNPNYSDADLVALDAIIDALNSYATTTATPTDAAIRTAEGFVSLPSGTPTFTDIADRATTAAVQTVVIPELALEITQYINPITTSPPTKVKRDLLERGQVPMDVCPKPKTVTVIEWVDCAATSIACDICPTTEPCDVCDNGYKWLVAATPTTPPCSTTTKTCPTCRGGVEYVIIGTPVPTNYKFMRPCPVCPGGYEYVVADGSDCGMDILYIIGKDGKNNHPADHGTGAKMALKPRATEGFAYSGTLVISSSSQLVVSTGFPLMADWSSLLTWEASATGSAFLRNILTIATPSAIGNGTDATATPTLDAAAMRKRGLMKYM